MNERSPGVLLLIVMSNAALLGACQARAAEVSIVAGEHPFPVGPRCVRFQPAEGDRGDIALKSESGRSKPAQLDAQGRLWWWADAMRPGDRVTYTVSWSDPPKGAGPPHIFVKQTRDDLIEVQIDGKPFTAFNFGKAEPKPFLYPVIGATGEPVTRSFPMKEVEGERKDHPHHRSIWAAHGDVRAAGVGKESCNFWHEAKDPSDQDRQVVTKVIRTASGPVFGQIEAEIAWQAAGDGPTLFTEIRTYTFFAGGDVRIIDQKNVFNFKERDVTFADTKEGGICSLRIASSMDEQDPGHGRMTNSAGQKGEKECWGKPAEWCDYVGPVAGETIGIAVFDAPTNFRHPVRWHIRAYGLYTANPFGTGAFTKGEEDGAREFKKGDSIAFDYRIFIHKGDTEAGRVADHYRLYTTAVDAMKEAK